MMSMNINDYTPEIIAEMQSKKGGLKSLMRYDENYNPVHGIYEDPTTFTRHLYLNGICYEVASLMWINSTGPKPLIAQDPWGTYPCIPPRPAKKVDK